MSTALWDRCVKRLERELPEHEVNMWIRPLQARDRDGALMLFAPNNFVLDSVSERYLGRVRELISHLGGDGEKLRISVGSSKGTAISEDGEGQRRTSNEPPDSLDARYTFDSFVQGSSNQLARAAAGQVAENPGAAYNPLLLYGGTGLGKTHLLHATGHRIRELHPGAKVVYLHSERFVSNMIKALRHNIIDQFKSLYRSVDALLIDDIQFFAGKERSQEEFFHTFNTLLDGRQQIILSCDRYPKEVEGLEDRLKSRFGWGLSIAIEPPDFETRVAILMSKAATARVRFDQEVAYFLAKRIRSNVRDLEGALNTLCANARFTGESIDLAFAKRTLKDLLAVHQRAITIENIQKVVAEYYKVRISDLLSKRRSRSITRPRQMAMSLAKELTEHSLPEIGDAFGGRDHTTVLHACRKVDELCEQESQLRDDRNKLLRALTT